MEEMSKLRKKADRMWLIAQVGNKNSQFHTKEIKENLLFCYYCGCSVEVVHNNFLNFQ